MPVRRLAEERFRGEGGAWLLAGNALHADLTPESAGGGLFGWVLCGLGQQHGFPVPEGGAGRLTAALVDRLHAHGGAAGVRRRASRACSCAAAARSACARRAARRSRPARRCSPRPARRRCSSTWSASSTCRRGFVDDLRAFQYDSSTVKVDWSLDGPIPWTAPDARRVGRDPRRRRDGLPHGRHGAALARLIPDRPFLVIGQYSMVDATRQPAGKETAWALHARAAGAGRRRRRRADRQLGRARDGAVRRADGGGDRAPRARLPRPDPRPPRLHAAAARGRQLQPRRRRDQLRHRPAPPAARLPPDAGPRTGADAGARSLPLRRLGAPGRRRARRGGGERGARGDRGAALATRIRVQQARSPAPPSRAASAARFRAP